jgi:multicomponent Na+:H+ antiporter subunit D
VGLLTMLSMTKIWAEAFWRAPDYPLKPQRTRALDRVCLYGPMIGLAALTLALGLFPQPFLEISRQAAHELLHPEAYIAAVLGGRP